MYFFKSFIYVNIFEFNLSFFISLFLYFFISLIL